MIRGLYTAASGMLARTAEMDTIANNMSNVDTPGFRRDGTLETTFPGLLLSRFDQEGTVPVGQLGTGVSLAGIYTSFEEGAIRETGNQLDLALQGNAWFTVRDTAGNVFATRDGGFTLDAGNRIVTAGGEALLGERGGVPTEIYLPGGTLTVAPDGTLEGAVDAAGQPVPRLRLSAGTGGWRKVGNNLFSGTLLPVVGPYRVEQGAREGSNVNPVAEMVRMIDAVRAYEANAKVIQISDTTLDKGINSIGSI